MVESWEFGVFFIGSYVDVLSFKNFKGLRNVEDGFCVCINDGYGGVFKFNEVCRDIYILRKC